MIGLEKNMGSRFQDIMQFFGPYADAWVHLDDVATNVLPQRRFKAHQYVI
jgi:hypothetical protein